MMKTPFLRLLQKTILTGSLLATLLPGTTQADEFRAVWVDAFGSGFLNASEVTTLVNNCHAYNFNAVVVQMRRRGDAFYLPQAPNGDPRTTALASGYDALQEVINQCHAATPRIEVHCWVAANLIWGPTTPPSQAGHVYNLHPEYLNKDSSGNTLFAEGYFLDPGNPAAMQWNYNMAKDVVSRYDIDGFHWDYIRYPQENSGYNEVSISRYNAEFGLTGQPSATSSQFKTWRRRQVTDFIRWTSSDLLEIKPSLMVSASVFASRTDATSFRFQDWATWTSEGIIDFILPMNYVNPGSNPGLFESRVDDIFTHQGVRRAYVGVGAYLNTKENTVAQLNYVRSKPLQGTGYYSYRTPNSGTVNQAVTFQYVKDNYQPTYEPVPVLPWIAAPTKAIIKGTVTRLDNAAPIYNATLTLSTSPARTQKSEAHGKYAFFEVDPGSYTVTASSGASNSAPANLTVVAGGIYNVDLTIDLPPVGDMTPPIITFVSSGGVNSNSAVITWTTDEDSDTRVEYGTTTAYGNSATNAALVTAHALTLNGLAANTTHHYRVKSKDAAGNESVSGNFQFTTTPSVANIIVDNPEAVRVGTWSSGTGADRFGTNYFFRTFGTGANHVTFTPTVLVSGYYQIFEWHSAGANRATNTPIIVTSSTGVSTNYVNQQVNGGRWNFIGTLYFNAGTDGTIRVSDAATGPAGAQIMADAFKLTYLPDTVSDPIIVDNPAATVAGPWTTNTSATDKFGINYLNRTFGSATNTVLFTPFLPAPGTYQVYEWHSAGSNRATNTPHVVTFNGGVTTNRVNQQVSGGQWNLFGTYRFNAGSSGSVRIRGDATGPAGAQVMADAMRFIFLPPPVPGELVAEAVNSSEISLNWTDNSTDEANFILSRSTVPGGPYEVVAILPADATSYIDSGLAVNTTYYYAVRATTGPGGASAYSNEASATTLPVAPAAPIDLTATAISSSQIDLAWTDNNEALDVSYIVSRSTSAGGPFTDIGTVESRIQSYNDTGLTPVTTYYYAVRAQNAGGDSANSNVASATTLSDLPAAPTGLTATAVSPTQVDLSWTDNASNEDSIAVVRAPISGSYSTIATLPADTTSYSDMAASGHTSYFYYLRVANYAGNVNSAVVQVTTPNSNPVANAGSDQSVSADGTCQASVTLDGSASTDGDLDGLTYTWTGSFGTASGVSPNVNLSLGSHTITLTVDDGFGGTSSATVHVTVSDTTAPALALNGGDVTVECHSAYADAGASASDACAGDLTGAITVSGSVDANTPGIYTLTYTVADPSGNSTTATRTVTVVDTTAPTLALNGSSAVTLECHSGYVDAGATASDICAGDLTSAISVSGSVDANAPGTYTLTYTVTDPSGNSTSATRTVSVVDMTAPTVVVSGSSFLTVEAYSTYTDDGATASDVCAGDLTSALTLSGSVDTQVLGTYTLTYSVTDASGNSANATRTVTVVDTTAPVIATPANLVVAAAPGATSQSVTFSATATDLVDGAVAVTASPASGSIFSEGVTTVTLTATDAQGNTATSTFTVTVTIAAPISIVRHAPTVNGGSLVQGNLQMLLGENVSLNGGATIAGDLLVPGTPSLKLNGNPGFGGTIVGTGSTSPTGYQVTLNGNASVSHLRNRTDAVTLPSVPAPPTPEGTRTVAINSAGQSIGDPATLKNLTLNGNAGQVEVPPGTYGNFVVNGGGSLVLGVVGSSTPTVYNLQNLTMNGSSKLLVVGPVVLTVANGFTANGQVGMTNQPAWLELAIANGGLTVNGGSTVSALVNAPSGTIIVNGNSKVIGSTKSDRLIVNGNGAIRAQ